MYRSMENNHCALHIRVLLTLRSTSEIQINHFIVYFAMVGVVTKFEILIWQLPYRPTRYIMLARQARQRSTNLTFFFIIAL